MTGYIEVGLLLIYLILAALNERRRSRKIELLIECHEGLADALEGQRELLLSIVNAVANPAGMPPALIEKLLRFGWGNWVPTPDVVDEDKELYLTVDGQHLHAMSVEEALALSDDELKQCLFDIMNSEELRNEAAASYELRRVK